MRCWRRAWTLSSTSLTVRRISSTAWRATWACATFARETHRSRPCWRRRPCGRKRWPRSRLFGTIEDLASQALVAIKLGVRLPSVDDPGLNFQLVGGEPLNPQAIEEPWRVGRHERRLISPVIEVVVNKQANVRHKN